MTLDKHLAALCLAAYLPAPRTVEIGSDLCANISDLPASVSGLDRDGTVVAFRGTANIAGWKRDVDILPKSHPLLGFCHRGFLTGGVALWQHLEPPEDGPVILAGHSLGGALAAIVGALRIASGMRVDQLVTFGAPRPGYEQLRRHFLAVQVRQYMRGRDPVTNVPLDLVTFPYKHIATQLIQVGLAAREPWLDHDVAGYQADV
jgi:hypothetical protein